MLPMNIISEIATPVSMSFRHYGNVMSGSIISILIASALQGLSKLVLGWLPGFLGEIPFLQVGLPAVLSVYFDVFSGMLQAFIFAMLTMMYVAGAFPADDYAARQARKHRKNA
jgi:F-type H+-transporting ATPase subunit a